MNTTIFSRRALRQPMTAILAILTVFSLLMSLMPMQVLVAEAAPTEKDTIDICHSTGADNNPYIVNHPAKNADAGGHDGVSHSGPVWFDGITEDWGDIIPPFDYDGGSYPGKNWTTEGQAFYNLGCKIPDPDPVVDLAITKVVDDETPDEGQTVVYAIDVINNGPDTTTNVVVTDTIPTGTTFDSANPAEDSSGPLTWNVGDLASGESAQILVTVTVDPDTAGDLITNTASAVADESAFDSNSSNDTVDEDITVNTPPVYQCSDGKDNDLDGLIDMDDPGCDSATDDDETDGVVPPTYQCSDGIDNDLDGLIDMDDPGCDSATDDDETDGVVPPTPDLCTVEIVSDTSAYVVERDTNAVLTFVHNAWTADEETNLTGASWIWADALVQAPATIETYTFQNQFGFVGNITSATLYVASDNGHVATLNAGTDHSFGSSFNNMQTYDVTSDVAEGNNELLVEVTNDAAGNDPYGNPAGALYRLVIEGEVTDDADCAVPYEEPVDMCLNIDGFQAEVPDGLVRDDNGDCNEPVIPVCDYGFDSDNLLLNPSFEEPVIGGKWSLTDIADWVITKVSDDTPTLGELWRGLGVGPSDGLQNVELAANEPTQLTQTVATIEGATYELRFDFAARGTNASDNSIDALVDGTVLMNANTGDTSWVTYTDTFVADTSSTDIAFRDMGGSNSTGSLLDNAVLCYVADPEIDTFILEGYVWHDDNENEEWEGFGEEQSEDSEDELSGWTVYITNGEGDDRSTTTDETGYYYFEVPAGTWTITEKVEEGWERTTRESHVVIVPVVEEFTLLDAVLEFIIPTAHAAVVATYGPYNFGNDLEEDDDDDDVIDDDDDRRGSYSSGTRTNRNSRLAPQVQGASDSVPAPLVLGEQVSVVPVGAPNAGGGGASPVSVDFGGLTTLALLSRTRRND